MRGCGNVAHSQEQEAQDSVSHLGEEEYKNVWVDEQWDGQRHGWQQARDAIELQPLCARGSGTRIRAAETLAALAGTIEATSRRCSSLIVVVANRRRCACVAASASRGC